MIVPYGRLLLIDTDVNINLFYIYLLNNSYRFCGLFLAFILHSYYIYALSYFLHFIRSTHTLYFYYIRGGGTTAAQRTHCPVKISRPCIFGTFVLYLLNNSYRFCGLFLAFILHSYYICSFIFLTLYQKHTDTVLLLYHVIFHIKGGGTTAAQRSHSPVKISRPCIFGSFVTTIVCVDTKFVFALCPLNPFVFL